MSEAVSADLYLPIERSRLYEQVANKIEAIIIAKQLKPADRLPSERELAEAFAVSRTVIREALKLLEARGLISILTGNGVFVTRFDARVVTKSLGMYLQLQSDVQGAEFKVHELRRILEVESAGLAAQRATTPEREQLCQLINHMAEPTAGQDQQALLDLQFHVVLAQSTHNEMIMLVYEPIIEHLRRQLVLAWQRYDQSPAVLNQQHAAIYAAVLDCDAARARVAMAEHLDYARQLLERFIAASVD